jgi:hypothetical protein
MSRERAALLHFLISVAVFSAVIIPLLLLWYPPPLFFADGGWNVIQIAVGVDIVVGPMLTLVVFKSGKKGLKFDLSVIALLQFAALAWGVHLMYQERPVFLVFADDRFGTVTTNQISASGRPLDELQKLGNDHPPRVLVKLPDDPKEVMAIKMAQLKEGTSVFRLAERYEAMTAENLAYVYAQSIDMEAFLAKRPQYREAYDAFMQKGGLAAKDVAFIPLMCRYDNLIIAINRSDHSIAGSLNIPPPDYNLFAQSHRGANKTELPGDKK